MPRAPAALILAAIAWAGAAAGVPSPTRHPLHVMSMNQCTDQIVLALLPPARIASVTSLSRDPEESLMAAAARRVAANHGLAEEVARQRPDLVVAGTVSTTATRALLRRLGWPMIEVANADSFEDIRRVTRQIAGAVDERARGEALIARMDARLADLARHTGPPFRVAAWDGGGFSAAGGSLYDAVLRASGAINVAGGSVASGQDSPDAEKLLAMAPDLLVRGGGDRMGLRENVARHPIVRRYWGGDRSLVIPQAYYICGTPFVADAALMLRGELRAAAANARISPPPFARGR